MGYIGHPFTDEHKAKISAANTGRPMHPNSRAALLAANTGSHRPCSDATKAKISAALTGKPGTMLGRKHTSEALAKMSAVQFRYGSRPLFYYNAAKAMLNECEVCGRTKTDVCHVVPRMSHRGPAVLGDDTLQNCIRLCKNHHQDFDDSEPYMVDFVVRYIFEQYHDFEGVV